MDQFALAPQRLDRRLSGAAQRRFVRHDVAGLNSGGVLIELECLAMVEESEIEAAMLQLVAARGADKTICPSEVARYVGGQNPDAWRPLMQPVRRVAVRLVKEGRVAILRKGRPVGDPEDFRGVYRIGVGEAPATSGLSADLSSGSIDPGS